MLIPKITVIFNFVAVKGVWGVLRVGLAKILVFAESSHRGVFRGPDSENRVYFCFWGRLRVYSWHIKGRIDEKLVFGETWHIGVICGADPENRDHFEI